MGSGEDSSEGRSLQWLFVLVLLAGIGISGYGLYKQFTYEPPVVALSQGINANADKARLDKMIADISSAVATRESSSGIVRAASAMARYPFGAPPPLPTGVVPLPVYSEIPLEYKEEILPPLIFVRGIIGVGSAAVVLLDIEGEPPKKVYRVGDSFQNKEGKITSIEQNKITIRYKGKNFNFSL